MTLHTNYPVSFDCSTHRLTLLAHYFDDSLSMALVIY